MPIILLQRILFEAFLDIFYFPVWWYTAGAKHIFITVWEMIKFGNGNMAPGLWLKNIFVPMYGQHDFQGRIISFVLRLVQIVARSIGLFIWTLVCLVLFGLWLLAPVIVVLGLFNKLSL